MSDENKEPNKYKEEAKALAKKELARRAIGGVKPAPGGVAMQAAKNLKQAGQKAIDGDVAGAAEDTVVAGAAAATAIAVNPLAGAVVGAALNTKTGKVFIRAIPFLIIAAILTPILIIFSAVSSVSTLLNGFGSPSAVGALDPNGGGFPITDPAQKAEAVKIIKQAEAAGLNADAALAGIVAALTVSNLKIDTPSNPNPLTPVGVFGFAPFEWAPQFWNGIGYGQPGYDDPERLAKAIAYLEDTNNSAQLFFATFSTDPKLKNNQWKERSSWATAKIARESRNRDYNNLNNSNAEAAENAESEGDATPDEIYQEGDDDVTGWNKNTYSISSYSANAPRSMSSLTSLFFENQEWRTDNPEFWDNFKFNAINQALFFGVGSFTLAPPEERVFRDGPVVYPKTNLAIERAMLFVGNAGLACDDGKCYRLCDHLAGDIWGYWDYSGYWDAKYHWGVALSQGIARPAGRQPNIGSLLFWDTGPQGHVATYVGNGMVVSNLSAGGDKGANVYLVPAEYFENNWGSPYLGWADPVFRGQKPGSALPCALPTSSRSGC